jgi:hypothetical protein
MGNATGSLPKGHFEQEIEMIMNDLLTPDDQSLSLKWESRPLRDDEPSWEYPKYLDDGSPRFFIVTLTFEPGGGHDQFGSQSHLLHCRLGLRRDK